MDEPIYKVKLLQNVLSLKLGVLKELPIKCLMC